MAIGKWIGGFLGLLNGGPLGALAGFALVHCLTHSLQETSNRHIFRMTIATGQPNLKVSAMVSCSR